MFNYSSASFCDDGCRSLKDRLEKLEIKLHTMGTKSLAFVANKPSLACADQTSVAPPTGNREGWVTAPRQKGFRHHSYMEDKWLIYLNSL